ncbi:MAG: guanine permease [Clostridiales bacterium]|nr:MAG: guanine permease [Clostridiales bacterium]
MLERMFKLKENNTTVSTEVVAGLTTFMTMAYILIVNPNILSATGMDRGAVFTATALAAIVGTLLMALLANYPFALAPGMGLNAYFAFTVVLSMGYSWQTALTAVFIEGIIFILLTATNVREMLFNSIPLTLKSAVSAGIGLFIAFIGFQNAGIIVNNDAVLVGLGNVKSPVVLMAIIGIIITAILEAKKVKGSILIGILATWVIGMIAQVTGIYVPNFETTFPVIPSAIMSVPPSIAPIAFQFDFSILGSFEIWVVVFAFLFVDLFDTLGTLIGVSEKAGFLNEKGELPNIKQALFADAIATTFGACVGTSTTTTFVESAAGVADGGRTGLTSVVTTIFFALALLFSPVLLSVPAFATAPALIIVGFFMMSSVTKIDFSDITDAVPAFLAIIMMPLTYSIAEGIVAGIVSYTVLKVATGKSRDIHPILFVLCILFILKYIFV